VWLAVGLGVGTDVTLDVFDLSGRRVIAQCRFEVGRHRVVCCF
jgi:hypothetical protein